jgi:hypothetical protein
VSSAVKTGCQLVPGEVCQQAILLRLPSLREQAAKSSLLFSLFSCFVFTNDTDIIHITRITDITDLV